MPPQIPFSFLRFLYPAAPEVVPCPGASYLTLSLTLIHILTLTSDTKTVRRSNPAEEHLNPNPNPNPDPASTLKNCSNPDPNPNPKTIENAVFVGSNPL